MKIKEIAIGPIAAASTLALASLVTFAPAVAQNNNAYITNAVSNDVSVIDTTQNTVTMLVRERLVFAGFIEALNDWNDFPDLSRGWTHIFKGLG